MNFPPRFGGWHKRAVYEAGEIPLGLPFGAALPPTTPFGSAWPAVRSGQRQDATIYDVQVKLQELGYSLGAAKPGYLDAPTRAAVAGFQNDNNLCVDGDPGTKTRTRLEAVYRAWDAGTALPPLPPRPSAAECSGGKVPTGPNVPPPPMADEPKPAPNPMFVPALDQPAAPKGGGGGGLLLAGAAALGLFLVMGKKGRK